MVSVEKANTFSGESKNVHKTTTISFRISEAAYRALQDDAKKQNLSINTLVNQIFLNYSEYDRFLKKFNMVKLSSHTLRRVLDAATDEAIAAAGKSAGGSVPESFILARTGELSLENALEYLKLTGTYSNLFDYTEVVHGGKVSVTLTHALGPKGSLFLSNYVESIFSPLGKQVKAIQLRDSITLEV